MNRFKTDGLMVFFRLVSIGLLLVFFIPSVWGSEANYRIAPGDEIEISVWRDDSLSRRLKVPPDGIVSFPLINDINANGLTVGELREACREKLSEYVPDPTVSVLLLDSSSMMGFVVGKVREPGGYRIRLNTTVMQLLSMAGGLNPYAKEKRLQILREIDGETAKIPFNYREVSQGENLKQNIVLKRGDVVVVP
jgi:polysaccharide export outer membrane protein